MRTDVASWPGEAQRDPHLIDAAVLLRRRVPSRRDPSVKYTVMQMADGTWSCTCPGFSFGARADGLCAHVDAEKSWQSLDIPTLAALLAAA